MLLSAPAESALLATLQQRLLAITEIIGNRLATLDNNLLSGLQSLQGKSVAIEITDLQQTIICYPGAAGIRLSMQQPAGEVDATIRARLMALVNLASQPDKVSTSIQEGISFHGDVAVAQRLQKLVADIDIDWEEILSQQLGDVVGVQAYRLLHQARTLFRQSAQSIFSSGSEYLQEEIRLTPAPVEQEQLRAEVTRLRHDVDRCEARLKRLSERLQSTSS